MLNSLTVAGGSGSDLPPLIRGADGGTIMIAGPLEMSVEEMLKRSDRLPIITTTSSTPTTTPTSQDIKPSKETLFCAPVSEHHQTVSTGTQIKIKEELDDAFTNLVSTSVSNSFNVKNSRSYNSGSPDLPNDASIDLLLSTSSVGESGK